MRAGDNAPFIVDAHRAGGAGNEEGVAVLTACTLYFSNAQVVFGSQVSEQLNIASAIIGVRGEFLLCERVEVIDTLFGNMFCAAL